MAKRYKKEERETYIFGVPLWLFTFWFTMVDFMLCAMFDVKVWLFMLTIAPLTFWSLFYYNHSDAPKK